MENETYLHFAGKKPTGLIGVMVGFSFTQKFKKKSFSNYSKMLT